MLGDVFVPKAIRMATVGQSCRRLASQPHPLGLGPGVENYRSQYIVGCCSGQNDLLVHFQLRPWSNNRAGYDSSAVALFVLSSLAALSRLSAKVVKVVRTI